MKDSKPSREELFALVWERPTTEVAGELGISDVALGKLCRRLQVPKPPRGYWAKVKAGKVLRKPPLAAYREETKQGTARQRRKGGGSKLQGRVRLSQLQQEFLERALRELTVVGVDTAECEL